MQGLKRLDSNHCPRESALSSVRLKRMPLFCNVDVQLACKLNKSYWSYMYFGERNNADPKSARHNVTIWPDRSINATFNRNIRCNVRDLCKEIIVWVRRRHKSTIASRELMRYNRSFCANGSFWYVSNNSDTSLSWQRGRGASGSGKWICQNLWSNI